MCAPIMLMCFSHRRYVKMAKRRTTLSGIQISCDVTDTGQWDRYTIWAVFVYVYVRRFLTCALQHTVTEVVKIDEETRTRFGAFLRTCVWSNHENAHLRNWYMKGLCKHVYHHLFYIIINHYLCDMSTSRIFHSFHLETLSNDLIVNVESSMAAEYGRSIRLLRIQGRQ